MGIVRMIRRLWRRRPGAGPYADYIEAMEKRAEFSYFCDGKLPPLDDRERADLQAVAQGKPPMEWPDD